MALRGILLSAAIVQFALPLCLTLCLTGPRLAIADAEPDFTKMSLEELMEVEVTTATKRPQRVSEVAAAIFVISQEDIRRSGARSIPEVLRLAPGVDVARLDANKWSVSIRGFGGQFVNKLLVLQDGRSLYTPLYGGVFWDEQDLFLEDIERIEVIRGPGGTIWGANAVNGVINIITKAAADTQGAFAFAEAGTELWGGGGRYGGAVGDNLHYRLFAKYSDRAGGKPVSDANDPGDGDGADHWDQGRGGFRIDWQASKADALTIQSEVHRGETGTRQVEALLTPPYADVSEDDGTAYGAFFQARWAHRMSDTSRLIANAYYDRQVRDEYGRRTTLDTIDATVQHEVRLGSRHELIWGAGYRHTANDYEGNFQIDLDPAQRSLDLFSAFIQDEITLVPDELTFTIGSKFEHNDLTGFEFQPSARMIWSPDERYSVWGSVSRAVRNPSIFEENSRGNLVVVPPFTPGPEGQPPLPVPVLISLFGSPDLKSETLLAYELGYRSRPVDRVSLDVAAFYNSYDNLLRADRGTPFIEASPVPHLTVPLISVSDGSGTSYGVELAVTLDVLPWWRLHGAYSWLSLHLGEDVVPLEGRSPHHRASLRSSMDFGRDWTLDVWLRAVSKLSGLALGGVGPDTVNGYVTGDIRLAWHPIDVLNVAIVGQNLFDRSRLQFQPDFGGLLPTKVERSVYGRIEARF